MDYRTKRLIKMGNRVYLKRHKTNCALAIKARSINLVKRFKMLDNETFSAKSDTAAFIKLRLYGA